MASLALAADGATVAAAFLLPEREGKRTGQITVWAAGSGKRLREMSYAATSIALSDDGALLAAGTATGSLMVWPLAGGDPLPTLIGGRTEVRCLAFGRSPRRRLVISQWLPVDGTPLISLNDAIADRAPARKPASYGLR